MMTELICIVKEGKEVMLSCLKWKIMAWFKMDITECDQGNYSVYNQSFSVNIIFAYIVLFFVFCFSQERPLTTHMLSPMPFK